MPMDPSKIKGEYLNGAYNELANLLGIEAVLKIYNTYRGQQLTLPVQLFSKEFIIRQIVEEYDGYNIKQLATKFGYSEKMDTKNFERPYRRYRYQEKEKRMR